MDFDNKPFEILVKSNSVLGFKISESEFDAVLEKTKNLHVLNELLKLKLAFINNNVHTAINFPVRQILLLIDYENNSVEDICRVLKLGFSIQKDDSEYEGFLKFIRSKDLASTENLPYLKLLKFAADFCNSKTKFRAFREHFGDLLITLLFSELKFVRDYLIVNVFPSYLQNDEECSKTSEVIWKTVLATKNVSILCGLWDSFANKEALFSSGDFWTLIQECLVSEEYSELKSGLYLMKQSLFAIKNQNNFNSGLGVIHWDSKTKSDVVAALTDFLILFDVSQEKQLYLIEPSYHLLPKIEILHSSWLFCLYKVLLSHSITCVRFHCIRVLLKSIWINDYAFVETSRCIFNSLNVHSSVYAIEVWDTFLKFLQKTNDDQFIIMLREGSQINWVPSVSYKFYKTIFKEKRRIFISLDILQSLKNNMEKVPHIHIRKACLKELKYFIQNSSTLYDDFDVFIKTKWILYGSSYSPKIDTVVDFASYQTDVETSIKKWCCQNCTVPKESEIVFKILALPVFRSLLEKLRALLHEANTIVASRVCLLLCQEGIDIDLEEFLIAQLRNLSLNLEVRPLLPFLSKSSARCLYGVCIDIINKGLPQTEVACEIITNYVELTENEEGELMEFWNRLFIINKTPFTTSMCALYLNFVNTKIFSKEFFINEKRYQVFPILENILERSHHDVLPIIANNLGILLYNNSYTEEIHNFINSLLGAISDWRKGDCFKTAIKKFIVTFYRYARVTDEFTLGKILNITWRLYEISCDYDYVALDLSYNLYDVIRINLKYAKDFLPVLIELLLRGNNLGSVQRAEYMICQEINDIKNNPNFLKLAVRAKMIEVARFLLYNAEISQDTKNKLADEMALLLLQKYKGYYKKRYSENCELHLQKLRILQALLIIHEYIESVRESLVETFTNSLCEENHQPSIKFFIQWLLVKLLSNNDESFALISSKLNAASKVHKSTIVAFTPILYHLVLNKEEKFWIEAFKILLPWTMGPHFNLRLYSQETLSCLYSKAKTKKFENLIKQFHLTADSIDTVLTNSERRLDPVDNFVYYDFQPLEHFHLGIIYYDIPKFTRVAQEEYENILSITDYQYRPFNFPKIQKQIICQKDDLTCEFVQKKIQLSKDKVENFLELVVVASLVDKIPNLGGLCRTCEVFRVKRLILKNKSCFHDTLFKSVSLTSENWIDIDEIKVESLAYFLLDMKEKHGYSVVGAEQTSNSIKLNEFSFPKKTLLVLGNEKEGIPPNLLPLLDFCVEIPQFGLIRSLNVHVAASTFIYEYTKQQTSIVK